jgi:hypothetical protein
MVVEHGRHRRDAIASDTQTGGDGAMLLTTRVLEHADQRRELGRAPAVGNVKPSPSRTGDTTRRRRLRLLGRLLLLLLVHCVRSRGMHVECE